MFRNVAKISSKKYRIGAEIRLKWRSEKGFPEGIKATDCRNLGITKDETEMEWWIGMDEWDETMWRIDGATHPWTLEPKHKKECMWAEVFLILSYSTLDSWVPLGCYEMFVTGIRLCDADTFLRLHFYSRLISNFRPFSQKQPRVLTLPTCPLPYIVYVIMCLVFPYFVIILLFTTLIFVMFPFYFSPVTSHVKRHTFTQHLFLVQDGRNFKEDNVIFVFMLKH